MSRSASWRESASRVLDGLVELPRWLWRVAKKLVWILGLLPAALDYGHAYIPGFPQVQIPLGWSIAAVILGIIVSTFLVHLDVRSRLAAYQYQEPDYNLEVLSVEAKACAANKLHVDTEFRVTRANAWPGTLVEISVIDGQLPDGLGAGQVAQMSYKPLDFPWTNLLKLPYTIPPVGCDFEVTVHYPVVKLPDIRDVKQWQDAVVRLGLLVEYYTQPVGYTRKCVPLDIGVDLSELHDEFLSS